MPELTANGINLYYQSFGSGEPLVFIHGFAVDHLVFSALPEHFQENYEVFLIDNRGSGQSDCPDFPYTIEMMADDILQFCQTLRLGPANFVGHSMGGMILQQLAHKNPEAVRSAVFCNTEVKIDIRYALSAKARLEFMTAGCSPRAMIENSMGWTFSSAFLEQPGVIEKIINLRLSNPFPMSVRGYRNQLSALLNFDSQSWVNQILSRCLVIGSDLDMIMPATGIQRMSKLIPEAQYQCISGAGHAPFIEKPQEFVEILKNFLK